MADFDIGMLARNLIVRAGDTAVVIFSQNVAFPSSEADWERVAHPTDAGLIFIQHRQQLLEQELLEDGADSYRINNSKLDQLQELETDFLELLVPWSPHTLHLKGYGAIGQEEFRFIPEFKIGHRVCTLERTGSFVSNGAAWYRLPTTTYLLLEAVSKFNASPASERGKEEALQALYRIKELSGFAGAELDDYLRGEEIVAPQTVQIGLEQDSGGRVSLYPIVSGVNETALKNSFMGLNAVQSVYDIPATKNKRVRVLVDKELRDVFRDLKSASHVGGEERSRILADPSVVFSDGTNRDRVDLSGYSKRVKGFGDVPQRARIWLKPVKRDWFNEADDEAESGISVSDGEESKDIAFPDKETATSFCEEVENAAQSGLSTVEFQNESLLLDDNLVNGARELKNELSQVKGKRNNTRLRKHLLIYGNEESLEYQEGELRDISQPYGDRELRPKSLKASINTPSGNEPIELKAYQLDGVRWLSLQFENRAMRTGCMLADDMGLGKTLQLSTFLAKIIENGDIEREDGYCNPILVVAPKILLDNWKMELEKFFEHGVFDPCLILHGAKLTALRQFADDEDGTSPKCSLAQELLCKHRMVITTYDTVRNYIQSLGRIAWSVIVADEAQSIKEIGRRSDALKALKAEFRIVCTGTPVENRLLDLWNLMDFAQPGVLFGSAKEFSKRFEKNIHTLNSEEIKSRSRELQRRLRYGRPDAFLLRRKKEDKLPGLPKKHIHVERFPLSQVEREAYLGLINSAQHGEKDSRQGTFKQLEALSDHYRLYTKELPVENIDQAINESAKLQKTIELLKLIQARGEKAIIFCRRIHSQTIIAQAIKQVFGFLPDIINGQVQAQSESSGKNRRAILSKFEEQVGFNIIILSPLAVGMGLTITSANNVIHFSRWYNPAKEAQATDRVYRIGQKRDVHVYYPIPVDGGNEFRTFDEVLEDLLADRRKLVEDFLVPCDSLGISTDDALDGLSAKGGGGKGGSSQEKHISSLDDVALLSPRQFEAFVAALFVRPGIETVVSCHVNDRGVDVFAVSGNEIKIIQCKHSRGGKCRGDSAVPQLYEGYDFFRPRAPALFANRKVTLCMITNTKFDRGHLPGVSAEVEVIEAKQLRELLKSRSITLREINAKDENRAPNLVDLCGRLNSIGKEYQRTANA